MITGLEQTGENKKMDKNLVTRTMLAIVMSMAFHGPGHAETACEQYQAMYDQADKTKDNKNISELWYSGLTKERFLAAKKACDMDKNAPAISYLNPVIPKAKYSPRNTPSATDEKGKPTGDKGQWIVETKYSKIDDSKNVYMALPADEPIEGKYGNKSTPVLIIRCSENKTDLYVNFDFFIGTDSTEVITRLDKEKAVASEWHISTGNDAVFSTNPVNFAEKLMYHDALLVKLTPYGDDPVMTSFDLRGLGVAIEPLRQACHW